ncbi:hypothetical protein BDW66DRAFT_126836 [Aspergillus desertorum]
MRGGPQELSVCGLPWVLGCAVTCVRASLLTGPRSFTVTLGVVDLRNCGGSPLIT